MHICFRILSLRDFLKNSFSEEEMISLLSGWEESLFYYRWESYSDYTYPYIMLWILLFKSLVSLLSFMMFIYQLVRHIKFSCCDGLANLTWHFCEIYFRLPFSSLLSYFLLRWSRRAPLNHSFQDNRTWESHLTWDSLWPSNGVFWNLWKQMECKSSFWGWEWKWTIRLF